MNPNNTLTWGLLEAHDQQTADYEVRAFMFCPKCRRPIQPSEITVHKETTECIVLRISCNNGWCDYKGIMVWFDSDEQATPKNALNVARGDLQRHCPECETVFERAKAARDNCSIVVERCCAQPGCNGRIIEAVHWTSPGMEQDQIYQATPYPHLS